MPLKTRFRHHGSHEAVDEEHGGDASGGVRMAERPTPPAVEAEEVGEGKPVVRTCQRPPGPPGRPRTSDVPGRHQPGDLEHEDQGADTHEGPGEGVGCTPDGVLVGRLEQEEDAGRPGTAIVAPTWSRPGSRPPMVVYAHRARPSTKNAVASAPQGPLGGRLAQATTIQTRMPEQQEDRDREARPGCSSGTSSDGAPGTRAGPRGWRRGRTWRSIAGPTRDRSVTDAHGLPRAPGRSRAAAPATGRRSRRAPRPPTRAG